MKHSALLAAVSIAAVRAALADPAPSTLGGSSLLLDQHLVAAAEAPNAGTVAAESAGHAALAEKLSNPVSNLISVPFQFNYDEGFGPEDASRLTLNVQPVIPIALDEHWNLITRTIMPVIWQEALVKDGDDVYAIGDITQSFFFSPTKPVGGWILGAGPVML